MAAEARWLSEAERVLGETLVEQRFEVAEAALGIEEKAADEGDAGLRREVEWEAGRDRGRLAGTR